MLIALMLSFLVVWAITPVAPATPSPLIPDTCDVTMPNGKALPGFLSDFYDTSELYTVDELSTWVPGNGAFAAKITRGFIDGEMQATGGWNKHGFWGTEPRLRVNIDFIFTGERATTDEPSARYLYPLDGSTQRGVVYELVFPEAGCWTITATTLDGTKSISFTTWVVFVENWLTPVG